MENNQVVHEFRKNATEIVKVEFCNFQGADLINIRVYFNSDNDRNEWLPTKKGITIRTSLIPELKKAIDKAYKEWETNYSNQN